MLRLANDTTSTIYVFGSFGLSIKEPYTIMLCPSLALLALSCVVVCAPPPGTWLDIETSYLVHLRTYVPDICTSNI